MVQIVGTNADLRRALNFQAIALTIPLMPAPPIIVSDRRGRLRFRGLAGRLRVSPIDKRCAVHWGHE